MSRWGSCPKDGWNYDSKNREKVDRKLERRCEQLLKQMRSPNFRLVQNAIDSRPIHRAMFRWMTPICLGYFAGNYRGDQRFKCLKNYFVGIGPADPTVGAQPADVERDLANLQKGIEGFLSAIDSASQTLDAASRLYYVVDGICYILAEFLRIHPYADGNGHMSRFIVWALLLRLGITPLAWPLEQRPPDPPYGPCLTLYRQGHRDHLRRFMLSCIATQP